MKQPEIIGAVEAVLASRRHGDPTSERTEKIKLQRDHGIIGDVHAGPRLLDAREEDMLAMGFLKGTEIANFRQWSAVSTEELAQTAERMKIPSIPLGCLGENIVVRNIPDFTRLPIGSLLFFQKPDGTMQTTVLAVWRPNGPCLAPGEAIARHYPDSRNLAIRFPKAALNRRGLIGAVYASGFIKEGDTVIVRLPAVLPTKR